MRETNQLGGVAVMARKELVASKIECLENTFCCGISIDTYGIIVLHNPPNRSEYRVPDDVISNCLSSAYNDFSSASVDKVLIMGDFNLPN